MPEPLIRRMAWVAIAGLALAVMFLCVLYPAPYDEALYRNFSKAFAMSGRPWIPEMPDGYGLAFHPYLVVLVQSAFISLGFEEIIELRILHCLVWVVPIFILTFTLAKDLWKDDRAALGSLVWLGTSVFFLMEASTAELDMPYTFFTLLSIWFMRKWHTASDSKIWNRWWVGLTVAMIVGIWVKFQFALTGLACGIVTLLFAAGERRRFLRMSLAIVTSGIFAALSLAIWAVYAESMGIPVLTKLQFVLSGLRGENEVYQSASSRFGWLHYVAFLAAYIHPVLFMAAAAALYSVLREKLFRRASLYLIVPVGVITLSLLLSGIREVRYFDPAIPLLAILLVWLFSSRFVWPRMEPKIVLEALVALFVGTVVWIVLPAHGGIHVFGFDMEFRTLAFLTLAFTALAMSYGRSRVRVVSLALLTLSGTLLCTSHMAWFRNKNFNSQYTSIAADMTSICSESKSFTLYRQAMAYGLPCAYQSLDFISDIKRRDLLRTTYWVLPAGERPPFAEYELDSTYRWEDFSLWVARSHDAGYNQ